MLRVAAIFFVPAWVAQGQMSLPGTQSAKMVSFTPALRAYQRNSVVTHGLGAGGPYTPKENFATRDLKGAYEGGVLEQKRKNPIVKDYGLYDKKTGRPEVYVTTEMEESKNPLDRFLDYLTNPRLDVSKQVNIVTKTTERDTDYTGFRPFKKKGQYSERTSSDSMAFFAVVLFGLFA